MDSYNVVVVEDDLFTRRVVGLIISNHFPELVIVGECGSVKEAREIICRTKPHLVILDIQLEDGNAFDLLHNLSSKAIDFKIVFMSAYQSYLEEAVQFAAVDFLKKPFDEGEFVMALDKAIDSINDIGYNQRLNVMFNNLNKNQHQKTMLFQLHNGPFTVPLAQIECGEAKPGGSIFRLTSGSDFKVSIPLRRYEILLSKYGFFRCHPLFVINLNQIQAIDLPSLEIRFISGHSVPFEDWRRPSLMKKYNQLQEEKLKEP
jgi:two-component system, LytTR family, response regulator